MNRGGCWSEKCFFFGAKISADLQKKIIEIREKFIRRTFGRTTPSSPWKERENGREREERSLTRRGRTLARWRVRRALMERLFQSLNSPRKGLELLREGLQLIHIDRQSSGIDCARDQLLGTGLDVVQFLSFLADFSLNLLEHPHRHVHSPGKRFRTSNCRSLSPGEEEDKCSRLVRTASRSVNHSRRDSSVN